MVIWCNLTSSNNNTEVYLYQLHNEKRRLLGKDYYAWRREIPSSSNWTWSFQDLIRPKCLKTFGLIQWINKAIAKTTIKASLKEPALNN